MFLATFRSMVYGRAFDDKLASLYRAGKIVGGVYLGRGQEAYSAALAHQLRPGEDIYAPLIRDQAGRYAIGEPLLDAARTWALMNHRSHVVPEDVQAVLPAVAGHRLVPASNYRGDGRALVMELQQKVDVISA